MTTFKSSIQRIWKTLIKSIAPATLPPCNCHRHGTACAQGLSRETMALIGIMGEKSSDGYYGGQKHHGTVDVVPKNFFVITVSQILVSNLPVIREGRSWIETWKTSNAAIYKSIKMDLCCSTPRPLQCQSTQLLETEGSSNLQSTLL